MRHFFYLHGFASSAASEKGKYLAKRFADQGLELRRPDFNQPDFFTLTVSRMLDQLSTEIGSLPPGRLVLIGSSLGGFVALHAATRMSKPQTSGPRLDRLVLLAPALDFAANRLRYLGKQGLALWQRTNRLEVFHYGYREMRPVHFALYEDAARYDSFATSVDVPILIFQGRHDESVDPAVVERFARGRSNVTLRFLEDDHQLLQSLEIIWQEVAAFLQL